MRPVVAIACALVLASCADAQQQRERRSPPAKEPLARFTAKVKWIEIIGKREGKAVPIGTQPELNWLVGIEILSIEKAAKLFNKKGEEILRIHSPAQFFGQSRKKVVGKRYSFVVFGELKDGVPRYDSAEVTELKSAPKKGLSPSTRVGHRGGSFLGISRCVHSI